MGKGNFTTKMEKLHIKDTGKWEIFMGKDNFSMTNQNNYINR